MPALIDASQFDLASTLNSGQVFHWREEADGSFSGCAGDQILVLRQEGDQVAVEPAAAAGIARRYLRLDEDHGEVLRSFPGREQDPVLAEAVAYCPGLRIIRQPLWECLASFLTSSLKQVAHIRQISLRVRHELGQASDFGDARADVYPGPEAVAEAGEDRLRQLGLGYRAGYVHRAAVRIASGEIRLEAGEALGDEELLNFLLQFDGVGEKIANCVRLFGYGRLAAFPVDVWIERVLRERYFAGRTIPRKELQAFLVHHFGQYGGYAQQYLFHYARTSRGNSRSQP